MAVFFVEPYVKYYNGLKSIYDLNLIYPNMKTDASKLTSNINQLSTNVDSARWKELGQESISQRVIPVLKQNIGGLESDVVETLDKLITDTTTLYATSAQLKDKDEEYEKAKNELEDLRNNEPSYYADITHSSESNNHISWRNKLRAKETEVDTLEEDCKKLQQSIDGCVSTINSLEIVDEVTEIEVVGTSDDSSLSEYSEFLKSQNVNFTVNIPSNMSQSGYTVTGYDQWIKSGKEMVWAQGTNQRALSEVWKSQGSNFKDGIAVVNVDGQYRYLIATTSKYGNVGDCVTVNFQNGTSIPCIIADQKSSGDSNYSEYGHMYGNQVNILEFEVERSKYQQSGNPNTSGWGLEWDSSSPVISIDNNGSAL